MKYLTTIPKTARRVAAVVAAASVAGLIATSAAVAASSSGAVLTADTSPAAPAAIRACTADDLGAWVAVSQSDGAAGTIFFPLQFTNLSRHACAMRGFPGVSAVDRQPSSARQPGQPGSRDPGPDRGAGSRRDSAHHPAVWRRRGNYRARMPPDLPHVRAADLPARPVPPDLRRLRPGGVLARRPRLHWVSGRSRPAWARAAANPGQYRPAGRSPRGGCMRATRSPAPARTPGSHAWCAADTPRRAGRRRPLASTIRPAPPR